MLHNTRPASPSRARYILVLFVLLMLFLTLLTRLFFLSVVDGPFLREQGDARTLRDIDIHAHRGMITDRNGKPLAVSSPVESIWIAPKEYQINQAAITKLAAAVELDAVELTERIQHAQTHQREFLYVKRHVSPEQAKKIIALQQTGLYTQKEYRRFYPEGESSAHLLGFTDIDDKGQEGLELAFEQWLQGVAGKKKVIKDRLGRVIAQVKTIREPRAGRNMTLSIDRRIQYLSYQKLREAVEKHEAKAGSVVVMDTQTGEVLAMANYPSFNPNSRQRFSDKSVRNRALTDTFEPASLIKPFSVANALVSQQFTPDTLVDTHPGWLSMNGKLIHDIRNYGNLTVKSVLTKSSNIGVAKMTLALPPEKLPTLLAQAGFGQSTNSGFPGEVAGKLNLSSSQSDLALATLSYGYGLTTTATQLAHAYSLFANHGKLMPVSLFRIDNPEPAQQVLPAPVADTMLSMLEEVVTPRGTAKRAVLKDYRVAGKTGTSRIVGDFGYDKNRHNAFFAGIAPVSDPRLVIVVYLHDPQGKYYYGGHIAAPLFAEIMQGSLRLLKVNSDTV